MGRWARSRRLMIETDPGLPREPKEVSMHQTTTEDRRKELRSLLDQIEAHPERDWTEARQRIAVLQSKLAAEEAAAGEHAAS